MAKRYAKDNFISNDTQSVTAQCKIVVYPWQNEALINSSNEPIDFSNADLAKSEPLDISSQILNFNYRKSKDGPTGSFTFNLTSSPNFGSGDWKDIIKRGTWCLIYLSQDDDLVISPSVKRASKANKAETKKLRCMGFIDRVAVSSSMSDAGAFDVTYEISGRDFGVVYEDTTIWHNLFKFDQITLNSLIDTKLNVVAPVKIDEALTLIHNLFFNPSAVSGLTLADDKSLLSIALQWLLPKELLADLGFSSLSSTFWGKLNPLVTSSTEAGISMHSPVAFLSGNAWQQLKKLSVPEYHELFTELSESGQPNLIFRPIPFAINKRKYPTVGAHISLYKDIQNVVNLPAIDVIDFNLGEDNHSRYNSFLATVSTTLINEEDNISILDGSRFPLNIQSSIKRHGFRPMHITVDSIIKNGEQNNGKGNVKILREFNEVLVDYWAHSVYAESGAVSIIGRPDIKLGKALVFDSDVPYVNNKRFYIEGYSDEFFIDENGVATWTQTVDLTRGFSEEDLVKKSGFDQRDSDFVNQGEFTELKKGKDS